MLWVKTFHVIAMVAWFAGLFYLPRLFVYHTFIRARLKSQRNSLILGA
ncbi:MAG: CopD family protein [Legionella sp.]|nr:CopD family protein [Legionella sp.]